MGSHTDELLEVARELLDGGPSPGAPNQGRLRRAVSTLYYAYFHFLIERSLDSLAGTPEVRTLMARAYDHTDMKTVCAQFVGKLPDKVKKVFADNVPTSLVDAARLFSDLQKARHLADYNLDATLKLEDARDLLDRVETAVAAWPALDPLPITRIFLAALLLNQHWNRKD
jgi:hypothetical protein